MIQKTRDEITLIVYDSPSPPRSFRISKRIFKLILALISLLLLSMALTTFFLAPYIKSLKNQYQTSPAVIEQFNNLRKEIITLKEKNLNLAKLNETFQNKGTETTIDDENTVKTAVVLKPVEKKVEVAKPENLLNYFKTPVGFKNMSKDYIARAQRINFRLKKDRTVFRFNLANGKQFKKLKGYIFVAQFSGDSLKLHPNIDLLKNKNKVSYNAGESFTVSRFRPTIATFEKPASSNKVYYKILVFSRTGDLLIEELHGPYTLE